MQTFKKINLAKKYSEGGKKLEKNDSYKIFMNTIHRIFKKIKLNIKYSAVILSNEKKINNAKQLLAAFVHLTTTKTKEMLHG